MLASCTCNLVDRGLQLPCEVRALTWSGEVLRDSGLLDLGKIVLLEQVLEEFIWSIGGQIARKVPPRIRSVRERHNQDAYIHISLSVTLTCK